MPVRDSVRTPFAGMASLARLRGRRESGGGGALRTGVEGDVQAQLNEFAEGQMLRKCNSCYGAFPSSPLEDGARSTIALAFSPDGQLLASTQCGFHLFCAPFPYLISTLQHRQIQQILATHTQ